MGFWPRPRWRWSRPQAELYHRAEELLLGEMPLIPFYFPLRHYLQAEELQDVFLSPLEWWTFKWASLGD